MKFSLNQKLAFLAFILSAIALVTSVFSGVNPSSNINSEIEYISVLELAEKIKSKQEFLLIDIRSKEDFDQFHIPRARNFNTNQLIELESGDKNQELIFYSEYDSLTKETHHFFKGIGFQNVFVVQGGVQDWYNRILYPRMPLEIPEEDQALADRVKSLSTYFGGRSEFVNTGNPLDYYKGVQSTQPKIESKLVRMGC